ncbi:MAG: hypothetical protein K2X93_02710 [Candidatus Obscuribacterales bacterium]|nr:hypothetical protein [Candidatus Obscuribacterales bacterium]
MTNSQFVSIISSTYECRLPSPFYVVIQQMAEQGSAVRGDRFTAPKQQPEFPDLSTVFDRSLSELNPTPSQGDQKSAKRTLGDLTIVDDLYILQKAGEEFLILEDSGPAVDTKKGLDALPSELADPPAPDVPAPEVPAEAPPPEVPKKPDVQPPPTEPLDSSPKPGDSAPVLNETVNAFGAHIRTDEQGNVREIQRTDGSTVKLNLDSDKGRIVETDKDNNVTKTWTLEKSGNWLSDSKPPEKRLSINLEPNGNLRYETDGHVPHVITSNGYAFLGNAAKNTDFDVQGRIDRIVYPGGKVRAFGYDGSESQPNHVSVLEPGSSAWKHFSRTAADQWQPNDSSGKLIDRPWNGTISIGPEGTYSTRNQGQDSTWIAHRINGQSETVKIDSHGTELGFDSGDRLVTAKRGSSTITANYGEKDKVNSIVETNRRNGEQKFWTKSPDGGWRSEEPSDGVRYDFKFERDGKLSWLDAAGNRFVKPADAIPQLVPSGEGTSKDGKPKGTRAEKEPIPAPEVAPKPSPEPAPEVDPKPSSESAPEENPKPSSEPPPEATPKPAKPAPPPPLVPEAAPKRTPDSERPADVLEKPAAKDLVAPNPQEDLKVARDAFAAAAKDGAMDVAKLTQFMKDFEQRCKDTKQLGNKAPSDEQIAKTYSELTGLLKGPQTSGISAADRADLAKLTMFNLAHPTHIDQGMNLCNVTTSEEFTASRHPENYAKLIKEVALTGKFTTTSGKEITLPQGSIVRDEENAKFTPETVGQNRWRNWASKIFQETGINSVVPFLQPDANYPAWGKPHLSGKSDMAMPQIQAACEEINGEKMPYFGVSDAPTAEELLKLKENGDFPAGLHTIHVVDKAGTVSGLHVQTIQDVRMRAGQLEVLLDNQRGGTNDQGWVKLKQMHDIQQLYNLPQNWYQIPAEYQGKTFDALTPKPEAQKPQLEPTVDRPKPQLEPPQAGDPKPDVQPEKQLERPAQTNEPGALETRRLLEEAMIKGIKGPLGDIKGPIKANREAKALEILDSFERRCADDRKAGLVAPSEEQITRAYKAALDTLTQEGRMPYADRHKMVLEGLRNVSDPTGIDQGDHGSCGNTCAEKFIAVRNPEVYMDALKQVALSGGSYTAPDGRKLTMPYDDARQGPFGNRTMVWQRGWKPDSEARGWDVFKEKGWHPLNSNETRRNYASQIMQNLNLADALESNRLNLRQAPAALDGLAFLHVEDFTKRLTGKPITTINQRIETEGNITRPLDDKLALQLKQDGRLPAMVWRTWHWQTIHDVRTVEGRDAYGRPANVVQVLSDNQWGNAKDRRWVTVPQLHQELSENP